MTQPTAAQTDVDQDAARNALLALRTEIAKAVVGQDAVVSGLVIALLCRGHVLLEGVPGVAKTLLVRTLAAALQLDFKRVQFTPDLMPGDITGSLVYDARTAEFEFRAGPVFTNLLLADEINRTPPKTQAALLEAMEERQVSVDGEPRPLPDPFIVAATQNPIEYEGTYQLPEAQLDRFLLKLNVPLPPRDQEIAILDRHARGFDPRDLSAVRPVAGAAELAAGRAAVRQVLVADEVLGYIVDIVGATGIRRRCSSAFRRAARRHCWPRRGRGRGCRAATTSRPTTSRRWPGRRCGTGSRCGRRPNSRAPTPTACSTASWPPSRCRGSGPHRPHRAGRADLRAADRAITLARNGIHRAARRSWWLAIVVDVALAASTRRLTFTRSGDTAARLGEPVDAPC